MIRKSRIQRKVEDLGSVFTQKSESSHVILPVKKDEEIDQTEEIFTEIKDLFSGSWMKAYLKKDGEREVSWGIAPYSNQSYFIIDFQNDNRIIIKGSSEGGKEGFDSYVGDVIKIEKNGPDLYRFTYKNILSEFSPNKKHEIVLRYNPENDTMAIMGYFDELYENPTEMIRISEPLHKERFLIYVKQCLL